MTVKVEVFTSANCPYCGWTKRLLDRKGIAYEEFRIDLDGEKREELSKRTGRRSVPQIFIGGNHVGGYEDLVEFDQNGGLNDLPADN